MFITLQSQEKKNEMIKRKWILQAKSQGKDKREIIYGFSKVNKAYFKIVKEKKNILWGAKKTATLVTKRKKKHFRMQQLKKKVVCT